jgi:hypothetical protein
MTPLESALSALAEVQPADVKQALIITKCRALMVGYDRQWREAPYSIDAAEMLVESDLWNPETQRKSRTFRLGGKLDVTAFHTTTGRRVIFDHKTTSDDIADPSSAYWKQLKIEGQVSQYMLLEWLNGRKADEAIWDVVRKPGIAPRALTKADAKQAATTGKYFGRELSAEALASLNSDGREDLEMYEARLAWDCTEERPQWYFARRTIPRLDAELAEYAEEVWGHAQDMMYARRENRHPRNSGACMLYNSPCVYLGICSGYDTPDSEKWHRKENVHVELPMLNGDGRDVLTNSRIRCFQTCRRKHYYQYELGIERVDEEDREALYFGNVWHVGQEAYFNALRVPEFFEQ